jgi:hypothetical protein
VFPWLACADLSTNSAWLFTIDEARKLAQQHWPDGKRRIYWFIDGPLQEQDAKLKWTPTASRPIAQKLLQGPAVG